MNGNGGAFGTFQERILGQAIQNDLLPFVTAVTQSLTRYETKVSTSSRNGSRAAGLEDTPVSRTHAHTVTLFPSIASSLVVAILGGLK